MAESGIAQYRSYRGVTAKAITALAVIWALYHVLYITPGLIKMGVALFMPQHLALHLLGIIPLTYLLVPAGKGSPRDRLPWYDVIPLFIGFAWNAYLFINFNSLYERHFAGITLETWELVVMAIYFLVVFEASRRLMGPAITLIGVAFLLYPLVSYLLPGAFAGPQFSLSEVIRSIGLFTTGMYGRILNISATIVISFIMFAQFLTISGAGQWFIDIAQALLGHVRGGPAKVAVLASSLMGTIQGTGVGNVATTGVLTIPLMKNTGYKPHLAAAVEAVASNGGQIMPPVMGISAFIMMDFLGVGYDVIVIAAILPAIVYYVAVFFAVDFEAAKAGLVGLPRSELPPVRKTLLGGWQFVVPLGVLLYLLLFLRYSPELSALYATAAIIVISFFRKGNRITPRKFVLALRNTATSMLMVGVVCALAGIVTGSMMLTGLSYRLSFLLVQAAGENLALLLMLTAIISIILGMGMPTSAAYILLAILAAPALVKMGMLPIAAHFFVFYFGVAAIITPPVCPASYVAAGIANASPMRTAFSAARLGIASFVVPFIFAYRPALLMEGSIVSIVQVAAIAIIAVIALAAGMGGYLLRPINYWWRTFLIVGGLLLIHPDISFTIIGIGIIAAPTLYQMVLSKLRPSSPS